ncbi:MAG: hypothetical protein HQ512_08820 [Rhodospirillales bacterium]|nr:hypothetical protein [Rhodospirillales bacterium]
MDFQAKFLGGGGEHHRYFSVSEADADGIYEIIKDFWTNRTDKKDEEIKAVIQGYRQGNFHASMEDIRNKVSELYGDKERTPEQPFSMIDFGGASGSIYYVMKELFDEATLRYVLVEPYKPFVDDFLAIFSNQHAITADSVQFAKMEDSALGEKPFDVFFSSHVLYLIKPSEVREVLKRAAQLTNTILLGDNLQNINGEFDKENPVIFDYFIEGKQIYFSHYFEGYFEDIGFEIVETIPTIPRGPEIKPDFGMILARRK